MPVSFSRPILTITMSFKSFPSMGMLALALQIPSVFSDPQTCSNAPLSCSSSSTEPSCCYNSPGGSLLLTQFWDYDPATGPSDSWTIHGLWYVQPFSSHYLTDLPGLITATARTRNTATRRASTPTSPRSSKPPATPSFSRTWTRTGRTTAGTTSRSGSMSGTSMV